MRDWITKLDDFLKINDREILTRAGKIAHEQALEKASFEYEKYKKLIQSEPSKADIDFQNSLWPAPALWASHK